MRQFLLRTLSPLATLAVLLVLWEGSIRLFDVPNYIFPTLSQVSTALYRGYVEGEFWRHLAFTLRSMFVGYAIGSLCAIALGALLAEVPVFERFVFPLVIAFQSMPKVALAPLIIVWFGFGMASKVVLVAVICFFPIFINVIVGLRSVDPNLVDMMRAFGTSPMGILWQVKLPHALGPIFAGLQIGIVLGLIGAIVGEFMASTQGLGFVIQNAASSLDLGIVFAGLFSLAAIGIAGTQLLRWLHARLVFWDRKAANTIPV
jgi:NitT/TauT family transport system permease protein